MGLIIKDRIKKFIKGYPTVSDKYNVAGGTLVGDSPVEFGDVVVLSATKGYFEKATNITKAADIGGIVVATNVKLNLAWPEGKVQTLPGEAFNLLVSGFIAVELDATAQQSAVLANAQVYVTAAGALTTVSSGNIALPNTVFTGEVETEGEKLLAEIYVK